MGLTHPRQPDDRATNLSHETMAMTMKTIISVKMSPADDESKYASNPSKMAANGL